MKKIVSLALAVLLALSLAACGSKNSGTRRRVRCPDPAEHRLGHL